MSPGILAFGMQADGIDLPSMVRMTTDYGRTQDWNNGLLMQLNLVLEELAVNVLQYGRRPRRRFDVTIRKEPRGRVRLDFRDPSTCAFMVYAVLKHPDVFQKVRREADRLFADGEPTLDGLREMDATHRAAMETMRMWPIAPLLFRTVTNAFEFGGHRIEAGQNVVIATTVPHYLPGCFPDPHRFDIDRYTPERAEHRRPENYAPFGLGNHRCLGNGFAEIQIATTMATLFHDLDLSLVPPGYTLKTTQVPLPSPRKSFRVRATRRR